MSKTTTINISETKEQYTAKFPTKKWPVCLEGVSQESVDTVFAGKRKDANGKENPIYTTLIRVRAQLGLGSKANPVATITEALTIEGVDAQIAKLEALRETILASEQSSQDDESAVEALIAADPMVLEV